MSRPDGIPPVLETNWDYFEARKIDRHEVAPIRPGGFERADLSMWYPSHTEPGMILIRHWHGRHNYFNPQSNQVQRMKAIDRLGDLGLRDTLEEIGIRPAHQHSDDMSYTDICLSLPSHNTQVRQTASLARAGRLTGGNRLGFMLVSEGDGTQPPRKFITAARDYQTPIATVGDPAFILHDIIEHGAGRLGLSPRLNEGISNKCDKVLEAAGSDLLTPDMSTLTSILNGSTHVFDVLNLFDGDPQQIENWMYILDTDGDTVQTYATEAQSILLAQRASD